MNRMRSICLLISVLAFYSQYVIAESKQYSDYKFGVFPYLSAVNMDNVYAPVSKELSKSINHKIKFRTSSSFTKFLSKLKSKNYDLALIQPFWYPLAVDTRDYIPLLKMKEPFVSLIMTLNDSPIRTVADLKGKVIATPPTFVPVVHMARKALIKEGLVPGKDLTFKAFKSVDSCFQQVLIEKADACVAPPFAPAIFEKVMDVKLKTILKSPGIPNLALVIHPRVPANHRRMIKSHVLSWTHSKTGKELLDNMQTEGFVPIVDSEYNTVRNFLKEISQ